MIDNPYLWLKAFHIISMTAWMAGMFYLPRLYVYHSGVAAGSDSDKMLQTMERKLLRYIINPAMILTFVFGVAMIVDTPEWMKQGWLHAKIMLVVVGLGGFHGFLAKIRKDFERGQNDRSEKFYRLINEVPTILLVLIVILVVLKPF